jgi:Bacterial archaeo-eukaryotic release factor family 11
MLHTDIPSAASIHLLVTHREPFSVSIYLPTSPLPSESDAARIELGNQLSTAIEQLRAANAPKARIADLEESIKDLIDDRVFWAHQSITLAIFATFDGVQTFRLPNRLSMAVEVADRFYIKPLLRAVTFPQTAFVLALSQNAARLIEVTADSDAYTVDVPGLPKDAASAVGLASISGRSPSGRIQGSEGQKVRMRQYARAVDSALRTTLTGLDVPLILAAAEPLSSIYRSVNTYGHLAGETIAGSPDERTDADLAQQSRGILDRLYAADLDELKARIVAQQAKGRAVTNVADIARAATFGAVDILLVDIDQSIPGTIDETTGDVEIGEQSDTTNYGVVDEIVRRALLTDARVFAVRADDVPGAGVAAASLRFPLP